MSKAAKDVRQHTIDELRLEETKVSQQLFKDRMDHATGRLQNPKALTNNRRALARIKTILREKTLAKKD